METKTVALTESSTKPKVILTVTERTGEPTHHEFTATFRVGRDPECQVMLTDNAVSKFHLEVSFDKGRWWLRDLDSTNGTFKGAKKVSRIQLGSKTKIVLGRTGPLLTFEVEGMREQTVLRTLLFSPTEFVNKYLRDPEARDNAGEQTRLIRRKFRSREKKEQKKYLVIIAVIAVIAIGAGTYAYIKHTQVQKHQKLAEDAFYEMKSLELAFGALKKRAAESGVDTLSGPELSAYLAKRNILKASYDKLLNELGIYSEGMNEKERSIYRISRIFGECEVDMPSGFVDIVEDYIDLWKKTPRLRTAIQRAHDLGYAPKIADAMIQHDLPPQFFYLALQESEFDSLTVGPPTRFGIAKGMWQFMPATAIEYGLRTGPLVRVPRPDPRDERQDVDKSTVAAAEYISDIYNTEAQASGLLVIASYNWGHNIVKNLIRQMPDNPRDRNFWRFFTVYRDKIPKQTLDYVFYIFSAAVIGDNPQLWGFSFDKPLPATPPPA
jgi:membrane-bound lytic murein transglycosylase D